MGPSVAVTAVGASVVAATVAGAVNAVLNNARICVRVVRVRRIFTRCLDRRAETNLHNCLGGRRRGGTVEEEVGGVEEVLRPHDDGRFFQKLNTRHHVLYSSMRFYCWSRTTCIIRAGQGGKFRGKYFGKITHYCARRFIMYHIQDSSYRTY